MCSASLPRVPDASAEPEVVGLLRRLIAFDTTNRSPGDAEGELDCARWLVGRLQEVGWEPLLIAPDDAPERASVVLRVTGRDRTLPALLVHAHLDVVPAEPEQWSVPPFAGVVADGHVWGRGAADMKDMAAATLAVLLDWGRSGRRPRRDVVVAFVADEETDGRFGARWLVEQHAGLFTGVEAAIGESGGMVEEWPHRDGHRVRLARVAAGERGTLHVRLTARGTSGHGSRPHEDNAVLALVDALHRIGHHRWPIHLSPLVRAQLAGTAEALGHPVDLDDDAGVERALELLGPAVDAARYTVRAATTPTVLQAGYKVNVIPGTASAEVDVRCPPGYLDQVVARLPELVGDRVELEHTVFEPPVQAPLDGPWFAAMVEAVTAETPGTVVVPGCLGGGTDAKAFSSLGIACYGFSPLTLDPAGRTPGGVHGVDERVPVASLVGGTRVLTRFLERV
ncbi:M20/M25/M40 family metallo-hydrolase [Desertihabitans brevis]|uniref:M20/M25/M40 family metallo-hydrolase n=1 Tax=Desertihabitans brevis TaxID=2268447 RepID=A0A367YYK5_9ACTN|nr:M20/M25/M40 family metallo-hydrolase [Desertihabitans brevis]RCK70898.1 M20/M25/M40 family metallo-hydrolase [Desertihabitans brevis]